MQVVNAKTIMNEKRVTSVAQKVLLQLNCKLGGELWACATPFKDLMVLGIDVFNDKTRKGSLVGVVSTINGTLSRYYSVASVQQQVLLLLLPFVRSRCARKLGRSNRLKSHYGFCP